MCVTLGFYSRAHVAWPRYCCSFVRDAGHAWPRLVSVFLCCGATLCIVLGFCVSMCFCMWRGQVLCFCQVFQYCLTIGDLRLCQLATLGVYQQTNMLYRGSGFSASLTLSVSERLIEEYVCYIGVI